MEAIKKNPPNIAAASSSGSKIWRLWRLKMEDIYDKCIMNAQHKESRQWKYEENKRVEFEEGGSNGRDLRNFGGGC